MMIVTVTSAQNADKKWAVGLQLGKHEYTGDLGNGFFKFNPAYGFIGLDINRYLNPSFNLGVSGSWGKYGYWVDENKNFLSDKWDAAAILSYKFNNGYVLKEDCKWSPYVYIGSGIAAYSGDRVNKDKMDYIIPLGAGLNYNIKDWVSVGIRTGFNFTSNDNRDFIESKSNDHYWKHSVGVMFNFGCGGDADKDGVKDKDDRCPGTPANVKVDEFGCPADFDKDGIADYLDKCPNQKGIAKFEGCPDTDGDGIQDSEDQCPTVAGLEKFKGCPDTDGDGIIDSEDKCPTVAGLEKFQGCPDTDGDGIQDSEDRCPKVAGTVALKGCPDKDGDGIADIDDKCPNVPGVKENKGCPAVKQETIEIFKQALQGIKFETGKDIIKPVSYPILDKVVKVMQDNPEYELDINGHTDNVGDDARNLTLSQARANAVKKYLSDKGIQASRMTATGFGETQPVGDNNTPAGRAENRRVEFKVKF